MAKKVSWRQHKYWRFYVTFFFFFQFPSNVTQNLVLIWFNTGARSLLDTAVGLIFSSDSPLDFYTKIWLLLVIVLNKYSLAVTLNNFVFHHFQITFTMEVTGMKHLEVSLIYLALLLILLLLFSILASVAIFLSKSELSINPEISDLFYFLFLSSILFENLL